MTDDARALRRSAVLVRGAWWAVLVVACACGRGDAARADSTPAAGQATAARTAPDTAARPVSPPSASAKPGVPACVSEGDWQQCSIAKRLTDAGFVPIDKGPAPKGLFDVTGTTYALGSSELHVYLFPSAAALKKAVAGIDTVAVVRRGGTASWPTAPTFITSNNLAAVLVSDNGRLIERVQNAITGGLPSASR